MFQLICDPSGVVVETTLKELVLAVIMWGNKLDHVRFGSFIVTYFELWSGLCFPLCLLLSLVVENLILFGNYF